MAQRLVEHINFYRILYRFLFFLMIAVALASSGIAAPGETALDFLSFPTGARSAALGQRGYASIGGPEAMYGNPAMLGSKSGAFASHQELLLDTHSEAAAFIFHLGGAYSMGAAAHLFFPGNIEGFSADNIKIGNIESGDRLYRIALARNGNISWGVSASYYGERLDDETGSGMGFGAGISIDNAWGRLGAGLENIGPKFKMERSAAQLPQEYFASALVPLYNSLVNLSFDLSYTLGPGMAGSLGLEYNMLSSFTLRAGSSNHDPLTAGVGIRNGKISLDYAYIPLSPFGDRHIISFSLTE